MVILYVCAFSALALAMRMAVSKVHMYVRASGRDDSEPFMLLTSDLQKEMDLGYFDRAFARRSADEAAPFLQLEMLLIKDDAHELLNWGYGKQVQLCVMNSSDRPKYGRQNALVRGSVCNIYC